MEKALITRVRRTDKRTFAVGSPRIVNPDEVRHGEILDWGHNAPSALGVVDYFVVQRKDGCFYLSYTTIPRDVAVEKFGQELIDGEFPKGSRIPLIVETVLDGSSWTSSRTTAPSPKG